MGIFLDRRDAGRRLAEQLLPFRNADPVVIALPRGGAPVGDEIARALEAPLDVLVARKLGAPGNPELAIGAIAPGVVHLEPETIRALAVSEDYIRKAVAVEQEELRRREMRFREGRPALPVSGRTVILVDDGLATGATAVAAIESLRRQAPRAIVLAMPVGAPQALQQLRKLVDEVVCLESPLFFRAVGQAYVDFRQTTDQEVHDILRGRRAEAGEAEI
jgi:predicted phosphoribosyltransferase